MGLKGPLSKTVDVTEYTTPAKEIAYAEIRNHLDGLIRYRTERMARLVSTGHQTYVIMIGSRYY